MITEIRCSKLHRPMNCLGYLSLEGIEETESGTPAKEGTAVGELLSAMIVQKTPTPNFGKIAQNGIFIDQDMWFYATDTYKNILETANGAEIETEKRIDWMTQSGIKIRGSFDISFVVGTTLHVEDLKYGWVIVDVKKNWQLLGYAIGQIKRLSALNGFVPSHIHFKIHQPRPHHEDGPVRPWVITYHELLEYWKEIEERMLQFVNGNKTLTTGSSCKYCEGFTQGLCPAANKAFYNSVDVVLDDWKQDVLSNEEISRQLELMSRIAEILKIKKDSLDQLAVNRITKGQMIPKYSIEQSYGDRKWTVDVSAKSIQALTGIDISKSDILSPAQAEKLGVPKKLVSQLVIREHRGAKLVKKDLSAEAEKIFTQPIK